ncbi:MAG: glycosyltransferase WbuB [Candidatus Altiarchaeales archaeon]|nr:MAG: glycosyltransferase WbuB [Candidatus Altiarchaeales archaeon]
MRILVVQESDWIGRGPHQSHHLMERMVERGHEVRVIDYEISWRLNRNNNIISKRNVFTNEWKVIKNADITVIRPPIIKLPVLDYISLLYTHSKEIKRQLIEFDPDVVIGFGILNAMLAINAIKDKDIPFVYYIIDELHKLVPQKPFRPLAKYIESKNIKNSDKVIVINDNLRDYVISMGADKEKTFVLRAGIDTERFNLELDGAEIRKKYNIGKDDVVLFFMGYIYDFSGLIEISKKLSDIEEKNIKLLIVGNGDAYEKLEEIRRKNNIYDRLILVKWQPYSKIPGFIAASDICILPAHNNEIMRNIVPIKIYEYMAVGKPVIATKLPGILREFGYGNGVIYADEPEEVIPISINLAENGKINEFGMKARRFVKDQGWNNIVEKFEEILMM